MKASDLIALFKRAYSEGWGYIYGERGDIWTAKKQAAATRDTTVKYGSQWIGKRVADCSGLFAWAFSEMGGKNYHGSNTIWNKYCKSQGTISEATELVPGMAVFQVSNGNRHHIGLYIGNGKCIEAKGTRYGVVESKIGHWDEWGLLKGVDYDEESSEGENAYRPTLRNGSKGDFVRQAQELLLAKGYFLGSYGADGKFGAATKAAVMNFQTDIGLSSDGVIGEKTWEALLSPQPQEDEPHEWTEEEKLNALWAWYQEEHGGIQNG